MPISMRLVAVAALVAALGVGALYFAGSERPPTNQPLASPSAAPLHTGPTVSGTAAPALDPTTWPAYRSNQYDISIAHPPGWNEFPATRGWTFDSDAVLDPLSPAMDSFMDPGQTIRVSIWAINGETLEGGPGEAIDSVDNFDAWAEAFCALTRNTPCAGIPDRALPMCLEYRDCHPAMLVSFNDDVQAYFTGGGTGDRIFVVAVWRPDLHPTTAAFGGTTALLQAFLSTVNGGGNAAVWPQGYQP